MLKCSIVWVERERERKREREREMNAQPYEF